LLAVAVVCLLHAGTADAAEAPAWRIVATSTPTDVAPGSPREEIQEIAVDATGGTFSLTVEAQTYATATIESIPAGITAGGLRTDLEGYRGIGSGNVEVSGRGSGETSPFIVKFAKERSEEPVPVMIANSAGLTGGSHTVQVEELQHGLYQPQIFVTAVNVGGAATSGPVSLKDALPPGVTATEVSGYDVDRSRFIFGFKGAASMTCTPGAVIECSYGEPVGPGDQLVIAIQVKVPTSVRSLPNLASVSGGDASEAVSTLPFTASEAPAPFGPTPGSVVAALSTQRAGAHPNVTTGFTLNTDSRYGVASSAKDIRFDLPPGLVGQAVGMPRCSMQAVLKELGHPNACPADSMVGTATVTLGGSTPETYLVPVYNIAPAPGEPVAFAFDVIVQPVRLDTSVLSNGDYGVRVTAPDVNEGLEDLSTWVTIWGVPALYNGAGEYTSYYGGQFGGPALTEERQALLTAPQQCAQPLAASMEADSWSDANAFTAPQVAPMGSLTGCDELSFSSSFTMLPDTLEAGAPAGYRLSLRVPQASSSDPEELGTPNVKKVVTTLPAGTVVNPSAAWGLRACTSAQFYGPHRGEESSATPAECPREAQVGTVAIHTPALEEALTGEVYLATPECDPCTPEDAADGRMVRLFLQVVGEGESGIVVKLEGKALINQQTGQITAVFENDPQLPFEEFKLVLNGGPRAVLTNPRSCGIKTTNMDLTPWSIGPDVQDSTPFSEFEINENCFGAQFQPSFVAGMTNNQAGEYSAFTLAFGRSDDDQFLSGFAQTLPPGLLGNLSGVTLCKEPQAAEGSCGEASLIGHTQVLTGPGADPFLVSGGRVFLTEGYRGAPFGLSIVVPAVAGPYTLSGTTGRGTVVVRARIEVNPTDAHLTVTADPLPTVLDGIPLQLKVVNVTIDRPNFTYNPSNCGKLSIDAALSSAEGLSADIASPFQVTNCARLAFKPNFSVATSAHHTRTDGDGLDVELSYPKAPFGSESNIAKVEVELPKQLPSRLTTLQKACPDAVFNANPASCPAASTVGEAIATTPIVPEPLEGPAYFVSHGGAKFPELIIALHGYGLTVYLHGETFINKAGVTSSTFNTVPDVPIGSFELKLPAGPDSALAGNGDLCIPKLTMPTSFTAQNGAVMTQDTAVSVRGCSPEIRVIRHRVSGRTATIVVSVPSAGTLVAGGPGVSRVATHSGGPARITIRLHLSRADQRFVARHGGRRLMAPIRLSFTPTHGGRLHAHVAVLMQ